MTQGPASLLLGSLCRALPRRYSPLIGLSFLIVGLTTAPECVAQRFVDLSSQVTVTKSGLVLNRATNTFNTVVTITNSSANDLNGPLLLVISKLSPTNVSV